jgi:polyferredoxin
MIFKKNHLKKGNSKLKMKNIRKYSQLFFLSIVVLTIIFLGNTKTHLVCPNNINCVLFSNLHSSYFILSIGFILSIIILIVTAFFGRYFCSYVCPIGAIQDFLGFKAKIKYPKFMFFLKYIILLAIILGSYFSGKIIYQNICPVEFLAGKIPYYNIGFILLSVITLTSIFWKRFFCTTLCPYAALMNITQWLMLKISKGKFPKSLSSSNCVHCGICQSHCSFGIKVDSKEAFDVVECIRCGECLEVCPMRKK